MNIFKSKPCKHLLLFLIGGTIYIFIEIIWRWLVGSSPTHWSMFILGGLSFLVIGEINEHLSWDTLFYIQCLIGTTGVLILEFIFGCIVNLWLNLNVWDYSNQPLNILGQVCISFALLWFILTAVAIVAKTNNSWYRVEYPTLGTGYISADYVSVKENIVTQQPYIPEEIPEVEEKAEKDNTPDEWAKVAVENAMNNGILYGDDTGDLKLHKNCTRQEMIVFLYRLYKFVNK